MKATCIGVSRSLNHKRPTWMAKCDRGRNVVVSEGIQQGRMFCESLLKEVVDEAEC